MKVSRTEMFLVLTIILIKILCVVESTWPDCIEDGKDFTGDDLKAGLRFSNEECARWCDNMKTRCNRWVYKEKGTWCHLKYIAGEERNHTNPLTYEDKAKIAASPSAKTTTVAPATNNNSSTSTNATDTNTTSSSGRRKRDTR